MYQMGISVFDKIILLILAHYIRDGFWFPRLINYNIFNYTAYTTNINIKYQMNPATSFPRPNSFKRNYVLCARVKAAL